MLETPLDLFLTGFRPTGDKDRDREMVEATLTSNRALADLEDGLIAPSDFFDLIEIAGHEMDSTLAMSN